MPADIRAIKNRIRSIESTKHITGAMRLVASSKIRRATLSYESARQYKDAFVNAYSSLLVKDDTSIYLKERKDLPICYIVIAADRGLCGGYNGNIFRALKEAINETDCIVPIGRRAVDHCIKKYKNILSSKFTSSEKITDSDILSIVELLNDNFINGTFGKIVLLSTKFISVINQIETFQTLLPIKPNEKATSNGMIFEPSRSAVMNYAMKSYLTSLVCAGIRESYLCELHARRNAMDSATENADAMINDLNLSYNRARQGSITQEITEIVAGAEER